MTTERPDEAARLARLLRDIEELEKTRAVLVYQLENRRTTLIAGGDRIAAIRASIDLLCDHITDVVAAAAEMSMLEHEIQDADQRIELVRKDVPGLEFESDSLLETIDEADDELERLSSILVERKGRHSKGH